jgi:hypothetical protein
MRKRSKTTTKPGRGARRATAASSRPTSRAAKSKRGTGGKAARVTKPRKSKAKTPASKPRRSPAASSSASDKFVRDLVVRGEAAEVNESGTLHPDATHVIVGKTATGRAKVKRARFKLF